ncbi:MAG: ABC-2 family transporter protein [bacterium]|nr:ABC-2 family transporter protein [bacterium]
MKKYFKMFTNRLSAGLAYRSTIFGTMFLDLVTMSGVVIFWTAVFKEHHSISHYSFSESMLYFLLIPFIASFTYVFVSEEIGGEIRQGSLSNYLVKPFKLELDAFCRSLASKINYIFISFPIYMGILYLLSFKYQYNFISFKGLLLGCFAIVMGFLLHFVMDLAIAWIAFWIGDTWAFVHFKRVIFLILGGASYPLEFVTGIQRTLIELLPFKYMYYIPASYLLGKRGLNTLFIDVCGFIIWFIIFIILGKLLWNAGLKKYEAYGN